MNFLNSVANEVAMENLLEESEESDFEKHFTQLDEIYDDQEMNFSTTNIVESDEDNGRNSETSNSRKSKWYIEKDGSLIHIKRALKLLTPREFISKERSRRHWVADSLHTSLVPIDPSHTYIHTYTLLMLPKWAFQLNRIKNTNLYKLIKNVSTIIL